MGLGGSGNETTSSWVWEGLGMRLTQEMNVLFPVLQEVDLYSVSAMELAFSAPYCLTARRNDYIDALVTYFTVEFSRCHKRTGITTCE